MSWGRQVEEATVAQQVLDDVQVRVQAVRLGDHPQNGLDSPLLATRVLAIDPKLAGGDGRGAADHLQGAGLAGAVGAQKPETLTLADGEVDTGHGHQVTVVLGKVVGADDGGHTGIQYIANGWTGTWGAVTGFVQSPRSHPGSFNCP